MQDLSEMADNVLNKKAASLISLCSRAGMLKAGEEKCEKALRSGEGKLVIISCDASGNTKKKFENKSFFYKVACMRLGMKEELGKLTGSGLTSAIVVTDLNFSKKIVEAVETAGGRLFVENPNI